MRWAPITSRALALAAWLGRRISEAICPLCCVFCGTRQDEAPICEGCQDDLLCAADPCESELPFTIVIAPYEYTFPIDAAIKALKFRRKLFYAPALAHLLLTSLPDLPEDIDALLPMPLHWRRHGLRGFNQAIEIARPIRKATGLPFIRNVVRCRNTPFQSGLTAAQRKRNLTSAFSVRGKLCYRHVLIVDDVITTGETCRQLADVLLDAGVRRVSVLAIARAIPG
jgi:ComF family protein